MSTSFIIFSVLAGSALIGACYDIYRLRRREHLIMNLSGELDLLLASAQEEVVKNKKLVESAAEIVRRYGDVGRGSQYPDVGDYGDLSSPEMLATIVTVLVNKHGDVRLSTKDFSDVLAGEYVSVYVDTKTQELVLSLNHGLEGAPVDEEPAIFNLAPKDDTYH